MKVINVKEVVLKNVPELKEIKNDKMEYVSFKNFDSRMKRIETQNLKEYGKSVSFSSLEGYFSSAIVEIQSDNQLVVINQKAYKLIRKFVTSESFVLA